MKIVQKAVITKGDKYLILLRPTNKKYFPNHWDFPGGKLEEGEDPITGLKREVLEETNLEIEVLSVSSTYEETYIGIPNRFVTYTVTLTSDNLRLNEEHTDYTWATKNQILKFEKIAPAIQHYFKG